MSKPFQYSMKNSAGFSLLEVLIAMFILVFISFAIYQATTETFKLHDVLGTEGDFYNNIQLAMGIVERDIALVYSPQLMTPPSPAPSVDMQAIQQTDAGHTSPFWLAAIDPTGIRPSRFNGTDAKMTFISVSHDRVYQDAQESVFQKLTYELAHDEVHDPGLENTDTQVLMRTENINAFDDDDRKDKTFNHVFRLLRGIKSMSFRYYRKDKDRWEKSWDNDKQDYNGNFPDVVEIKLEVIGPNRLDFEGIYKFRLEEPLNGLDPST